LFLITLYFSSKSRT